MNLIESIYSKAKADRQRILLPETSDLRILEAASKASQAGIADIVLLGEEEKIKTLAAEHNLDISACEFIPMFNNSKIEKYRELYYEMRKHKGMTAEQAEQDLKEAMNLACVILKAGEVDGIVAGAVHSSSEVLRAALRIIRTAENSKLVSSFFIMDVPNVEFGEDGLFAFADCALIESPNEEQLSEIAISTAKSFSDLFDIEAKVAMLSYSTMGSASSELTEKVIKASTLAKERAPQLLLDGELQLDAAIVPEIAAKKAPNSSVAGYANILVFPDLNSGNIAYKLVQRLAHADAFGPITQGLAKPVNDLSRGSTVEDILGVIAITAIQAQH